MKITSDWHIHSRHSCDEASLRMGDLVSGAAAHGILDFGVTDHLHTPYNRPDLEASRCEYEAVGPSPHFHFGVEVSVVSQWELGRIAAGACDHPVYGIRSGGPAGAEPAIGLGPEDVHDLGIEYVVGGTHWPLYVPFEREAIIRDYHRQNLFLATHPLVTIVAHPWWWMGHWRDEDGCYRGKPWFDDFRHVPTAMHDEFASASVQHGKLVEINLSATVMSPKYPDRFKAQYVAYLAYLRERGVRFSIATDCHASVYGTDFERASDILAGAGFKTGDVWKLKPRGKALGRASGQRATWRQQRGR